MLAKPSSNTFIKRVYGMKKWFSYLLHSLSDIRFTIISLLGGKTVGVRALVIKEGKILLVKHTYAEGWYTIGGGIEKGETPLEAIKRELMEEVGLQLEEVPQLFGVYYNDFQKRGDYVILYLVKSFTMHTTNSLEIERWAWYPLQDLPRDITPATRRRIEEFIGKRAISSKW